MSERFPSNTLNRAFALGAGVLTIGSGAALAKRPAETPLPRASLAQSYSEYDPLTAGNMIARDLMPNEPLTPSKIDLTPSTANIEGGCENPSNYRIWLDTPESLQKVKCDNTQAVTPHNADPFLQTRYQTELNKVGYDFVTSTSGFSIDFKQKGKSVDLTPQNIKEEFDCVA